ncbi:MAG: tRNA (adenosine(37)-N6)-dimethylallyltransferase MiaA [Candidatus Dasytiphilus stammeri]
MFFLKKKPKAIFLMGPTASGKTSIAIKLHQILPVEIISVDSVLIYRGMNIGTSKPSPKVLNKIPHRLIDICDPAETYSVANFYQDAISEMNSISQMGKIPLLVGGSMLYYKTLLEGLSPLLPRAHHRIRYILNQQAKLKGWQYLHEKLCEIDPVSGKRIHYNDQQRILRAIEVFLISGKTLTSLLKIPGQPLPYDIYQFIIIPVSRRQLYDRIKKRFLQMIASGFENEVQKLFLRNDLHINLPSMRSVGYRQMWFYLEGKINYEEMITKGIYATYHLAKKQLTWMRHWKNFFCIDSSQPILACDKILKIFNYNS